MTRPSSRDRSTPSPALFDLSRPSAPSPSPSSAPSQQQHAGEAYTWILDHVLTYPVNYEIPLRTMYTLNSSPRAQPLPHGLSRPASEEAPKPAGDVAAEAPPSPQQDAAHSAAATFKSNLMNQIAQLPSQPCSLPPSFITSFARRCFPEDLTLVDFPQALTGMDYLRDLETRRRRELAAALRRLNIDRRSLGPDGEERGSGNPAIARWVKAIEEKERKVEALYTQVYIGLRRWTIINEMSLLPFNKSNCLAMLNTLYPPSTASQPTRTLTPAILHAQRNGFWRYIQAVEKNGPGVLDNLMMQGHRAERGDANGWPSVREVLDMYLRAANGVIDECADIAGVETFGHGGVGDGEDQRRKGRKVDSGVSFSTDDRPSTSSSSTRSKDKPLPSPPSLAKPSGSSSGGSTLERIARELRRLRDRNKVEEMQQRPREGAKEAPARVKTRSLKKMKSASALGELRERNKSFVAGHLDRSRTQPAAFELDEAARRRAILEASAAAGKEPARAKHRPLLSAEI
ncbi:MAG: hypothetical protein M1832_005565 [Thelocarpon impressellum]|nr:MAG: hypothetical protein M1832_005565 [Thelocarpon impressellum]